MNTITLDRLVPNVFSDCKGMQSDVWNKTVDFSKGNSYLIAAESGTGKSSLFDYIYGRRNDYSGTLLVDGHPITSMSTREKQELRCKHLSIVFQGFRLFPELTAWENVVLKNKLTGYKRDEEISAFFEELGIASKKNELVRKLSFGQQQRVAIIRALCQPFDFMLLDEPFGHLDEQNQQTALSLVLREVAAQKAGLLLCSLGFDYGISYTSIKHL